MPYGLFSLTQRIDNLSLMADEYKPNHILLTGGLGFIGSHVVKALVNIHPEYDIVVLDRLNPCASEKNLDGVPCKVIIGDICSQDLVNYILKEHQIDTIMHFAAQTHVDNSFGNSFEFTKSNILGTHVLLEAACQAKIKRFIHVSTDEVYGETDERMKEHMVLDPTNPYAATKASAEFLVKSYHKSYGLPTIISRGNNVYGPNQYPEKLIPKFINLLILDRKCCIHGDGSNTRSFLYVTDVAHAFIILLHNGVNGEVYNIGTEFEISNLEVAQQLIHLMDKSEDLLEYVEDRKFNDQRYHISSDKLERLGWRPSVEWSDGLKSTIEWYRNNRSHWSAIDSVLNPHPKN
jgi:UDP-glucose 4,6-dehydratase